MKKALALVLALVLALSLGVTAFAARPGNVDITITPEDAVVIVDGYKVNLLAEDWFNYGWTADQYVTDLNSLNIDGYYPLTQYAGASTEDTSDDAWDTFADNYKITYIGGKEFGTAKIDGTNLIVTATSKALVETGTLKFAVQGVKSVIGDDGKTDIIKSDIVYFEFDIVPNWIGGSDDANNVAVDVPVKLYLDEFVISAKQFGTLARNTLTVNSIDNEFVLTTKVAKDQGAFNFKYDTTVDEDVLDANEDANILAINFKGTQTFKNDAKLTFSNKVGSWLSLGDVIDHTGDETVYVYTFDGEKLTLVDKVDASKGDVVYTAKAGKALGSIYFSDKELKGAATSSSSSSSSSSNKGNVDTGANDMVSVAVAMAVVSLAAAGAVAFKKASK